MQSTPAYCSHCGAPLRPGTHFCAGCGQPVTTAAHTNPPGHAPVPARSGMPVCLIVVAGILTAGVVLLVGIGVIVLLWRSGRLGDQDQPLPIAPSAVIGEPTAVPAIAAATPSMPATPVLSATSAPLATATLAALDVAASDITTQITQLKQAVEASNAAVSAAIVDESPDVNKQRMVFEDHVINLGQTLYRFYVTEGRGDLVLARAEMDSFLRSLSAYGLSLGEETIGWGVSTVAGPGSDEYPTSEPDAPVVTEIFELDPYLGASYLPLTGRAVVLHESNPDGSGGDVTLQVAWLETEPVLSIVELIDDADGQIARGVYHLVVQDDGIYRIEDFRPDQASFWLPLELSPGQQWTLEGVTTTIKAIDVPCNLAISTINHCMILELDLAELGLVLEEYYAPEYGLVQMRDQRNGAVWQEVTAVVDVDEWQATEIVRQNTPNRSLIEP